MAHYGNFAFRKSTSLSVFEFGMEPFFGNAIFLEAHKQNTANLKIENPIFHTWIIIKPTKTDKLQFNTNKTHADSLHSGQNI